MLDKFDRGGLVAIPLMNDARLLALSLARLLGRKIKFRSTGKRYIANARTCRHLEERRSPLLSARLFVSSALHYPRPALITFESSCMRRSLCHRSLKELFMRAWTNDAWTEGIPRHPRFLALCTLTPGFRRPLSISPKYWHTFATSSELTFVYASSVAEECLEYLRFLYASFLSCFILLFLFSFSFFVRKKNISNWKKLYWVLGLFNERQISFSRPSLSCFRGDTVVSLRH